MELEADYIVDDVLHSKLGASGAHRWMNCSGSNTLIDKLGPKVKRAGQAAELGTAAHTVLSTCLEKDMEPWEMAGLTIDTGRSKFEVDDDMVSAVSVCNSFIASLIKDAGKGAKVYIEESLKDPEHEDIFGTTDFGLYVPKKSLTIVDYKHGEGVVVEPTYPQMKYYARLLLYRIFGNKAPTNLPVILYIVQPRLPHPKGSIRKYETTAGQLIDWWDGELIPAAKRTKDPNALLTVGDWCKFCPAREHCPALRKETLGFNTDLEPDYLTGEEIGELLAKSKSLIAFFQMLEKEAFKRILTGAKVPGYKLVRKKANRVWKATAEKALREEYGQEAFTTPVLKSPPQIEQLEGGKKFASRYAFTPDVGLTIAPSSDKREEVGAAMDLFLENEILVTEAEVDF